jgi:type VI secretion system protein ImpA
MPFDCAVLLAPVSGDKPCGEALPGHALYEEFRNLVGSPTRPDWARYLDRAVAVAQTSRDLRAWVWLTRASLCQDGVLGLATGLRLMADGLQRYWDELPPQDMEETDPGERFMARLSALTLLGATNFRSNLDELQRNGRNVADLRADLDAMVAKAAPDPATRAAIDGSRAAIGSITRLFAERFGPGRDPQLGFEVILDKLKAIEPKFRDAAAPAPGREGAGVAAAPSGAAPAASAAANALGPVTSRDDVVRALNLVLDYYKANEPSSPVPLLVQRAKRLVPMSFMDAIKDLAPAGLKELQAVSGNTDEKK